ncbi:hypothetical protein HK101_004243 [Irineochytrium annulatum]|nr:hypothetical protein HK101_004243 [Irineochytrium annulatum]
MPAPLFIPSPSWTPGPLAPPFTPLTPTPVSPSPDASSPHVGGGQGVPAGGDSSGGAMGGAPSNTGHGATAVVMTVAGLVLVVAAVALAFVMRRRMEARRRSKGDLDWKSSAGDGGMGGARERTHPGAGSPDVTIGGVGEWDAIMDAMVKKSTVVDVQATLEDYRALGTREMELADDQVDYNGTHTMTIHTAGALAASRRCERTSSEEDDVSSPTTDDGVSNKDRETLHERDGGEGDREFFAGADAEEMMPPDLDPRVTCTVVSRQSSIWSFDLQANEDRGWGGDDFRVDPVADVDDCSLRQLRNQKCGTFCPDTEDAEDIAGVEEVVAVEENNDEEPKGETTAATPSTRMAAIAALTASTRLRTSRIFATNAISDRPDRPHPPCVSLPTTPSSVVAMTAITSTTPASCLKYPGDERGCALAALTAILHPDQSDGALSPTATEVGEKPSSKRRIRMKTTFTPPPARPPLAAAGFHAISRLTHPFTPSPLRTNTRVSVASTRSRASSGALSVSGSEVSERTLFGDD